MLENLAQADPLVLWQGGEAPHALTLFHDGSSPDSLQRIRRRMLAVPAGQSFIEQGESKIEMRRQVVERERVHPVEALRHQLAQLPQLRMDLGIVEIETRTAAQRHFLPPG